MPSLRIQPDKGDPFTYEIRKDVLSIGRSMGNDVLLPDSAVSRKHAQLKKTREGYLLIDMGSQNGTFVNGTLVSRRLLRPADLILIGSYKLTFLEESQKPSDLLKKPEPLFHETLDQREEEVLQNVGPGSESEPDQRLLVSVKAEEAALKRDIDKAGISEFKDLEKSNKILFVLYQISRQLNTAQDFDTLLNTIMDSIFQVIDADHGFVALLGDRPGELVPKVVKYRNQSDGLGQELRISRTIIDKVVKEKVSVLTSNAMEDRRFEGAESVLMQNIRSVMSVPLWRKDDIIGIIQVDSFRLSNKFTKADLDLLTTISSQMAMVIEQANLNEKIRREREVRNRLERFHSPEVVDLIIHSDGGSEEALLAPKEKKATILFTDIVNFTPIAERFPPADVSDLLNKHFTQMTDIIFKYDGTLDKYIGDAIMAVFGAPIEREDDAEKAVMAALDMRRALVEMMDDMEEARRFDMRLGINSGRVVAGNLGSPKRMDYTVIGDVVNTAARIESIAQPNQILIGEPTYKLVQGKFNIREAGKRTVKGKREAIRVYEVLD
ncbi:MAG: GAF domain-containing protein [Deltaproteobacteria bacterium]|nr:GAF domain-containing protein [Deltaproteobacteria bacterium]MBW2136264.1 GAF domain-containing protein [Deltaproteobacteria bacterium]